jgi:hypothetical protein
MIDIQKELEPHLVELASERNAVRIMIEQWQAYGKKLRDIAARISSNYARQCKTRPQCAA